MKENINTKEIVGGQSVSGPIINGIVNLFMTIFEIGRQAGGAIRRIESGNVCPL